MISEMRAAYVWVWLAGATEPVPAGKLEQHEGADVITFAYGKSYLAREDARPLYHPELPLRRGRQEPLESLKVAGVIRDGGPDAWGQRVILRRLLGTRDVRNVDPGNVSLLTYLLESGSNRPGALDFQASAETYEPRTHSATLEQLQQGAADVESGAPMSQELLEALEAGSSVGGARPKATLSHGDRHVIAKFSSLTDNYPVMKAEAVAMDLARRVGLNVAKTELVQVEGRDVLLVERFDRGPGGTRRAFISALTIAKESEMNPGTRPIRDSRTRSGSDRPPAGKHSRNSSPGSCSTSWSATRTTMPGTTLRSWTGRVDSSSLPPTISVRKTGSVRRRPRRWPSDLTERGCPRWPNASAQHESTTSPRERPGTSSTVS